MNPSSVENRYFRHRADNGRTRLGDPSGRGNFIFPRPAGQLFFLPLPFSVFSSLSPSPYCLFLSFSRGLCPSLSLVSRLSLRFPFSLVQTTMSRLPFAFAITDRSVCRDKQPISPRNVNKVTLFRQYVDLYRLLTGYPSNRKRERDRERVAFAVSDG